MTVSYPIHLFRWSKSENILFADLFELNNYATFPLEPTQYIKVLGKKSHINFARVVDLNKDWIPDRVKTKVGYPLPDNALVYANGHYETFLYIWK